MPRPIIGFEEKVKSMAVGSDHCAVVTGMILTLC